MFTARPGTYVPHSFPLGGYGYGYAGGAAYGLDASATAADDVAAGYLEVQGEPVTAQVYVDGLYVGTIDDVRRAGRAVDPGAHHVEVRAEGYDSLSVDVRIDPGETTVYRAALKPVASRTAGPPPPEVLESMVRGYLDELRRKAFPAAAA